MLPGYGRGGSISKETLQEIVVPSGHGLYTFPMREPVPAFLILGAAKSGTSALHRYLLQHPQVFMPTPKELRFFAYEGGIPEFRGPGDREANQGLPTTWTAYLAFFRSAGNRVCGEASPIYLYHPRAPERIHRYLPEARMIVILRHPVERAFSHYLHLVRSGRETLSFREALEAEERRIREGWEWSWHYRRVGLYGEQLERYFALFPKEQFRIFLYEEFSRDPAHVLREILSFIGVDPEQIPSVLPRVNVSGIPRNRTVFQVWWGVYTRPNPLKTLAKRVLPARVRARIGEQVTRTLLRKPRIPPDLFRELLDFYREDIQKLSRLLGRDLSHWLDMPDR